MVSYPARTPLHTPGQAIVARWSDDLPYNEQTDWNTMNGTTGTIFRIKKYAIHDGPGIRTTVFLKGCPLSCWWCHNPEGQTPTPQTMARAKEVGGREKVTGKAAGSTETIGKTVSLSAVMAEVEKDVIFYDESGGGVTFSGGEPLVQADFLSALLSECAEKEIHTAVDTTGYADARTFSNIAEKANLLLFDLKIMDEARHLKYTGVSNRRILENLKRASRIGTEVMIRFPVIPGINDGDENVQRTAGFIRSLDTVKTIAVLPFHSIANGKYERLGMPNRTCGIEPPTAARIKEIKHIFEAIGLNVIAGG